MLSIFVATLAVPIFSYDEACRSPKRAVDLLVFEDQDDSLELSPVAWRKIRKHVCPAEQPAVPIHIASLLNMAYYYIRRKRRA